MQKRREPTRGGIARLSVFSLVSVIAVAIAGCGSESSADAAAGMSTRQQAAEQSAGTESGATAVVANSVLPAAALSAWEGYARGECRDMGVRFSTVRFAPIQSVDLKQESAANEGAFIVAEFNGDGRPDFVVTTQNWGCAEEADHGKMGPPYDFIISTAAGYQVAYGFNGDIGPEDVKRRGKRDVVEYRRGWNGNCGYIETAVWGWNGTQMDVIERRDDKGKLVDKEGCAVGAQAAAGPASFPPIPKGYYAVGTTCARAASAQAASDGPGSLAHFDESALTWFDGGPEIRSFESLGNNRFRVHARSYGNGDDTKGTSTNFVIRVTGASSFVAEAGSTLFDEPETYTHCPTDTVPKGVRDWFEG